MAKTNKLFESLRAGLEEAIAHQQGKIRLRTEFIEVPETHKKSKARKNNSLFSDF